MIDKPIEFDFSVLVAAIRQVDEHMGAQAGRAVNISLTLRNWAIGCYIREYEQNGIDRAEYGANLLDTLSERLSVIGLQAIAPRTLRLYRQFYLTYPWIWQTVSAKSSFDLLPDRIRKSLISKSGLSTKGKTAIY